jgi:SnoaL-like domain
MSDAISNLMDSNLLQVFNERDDDRRAAAIARTYTDEVSWTSDEGVTVGHDALQDKARELLDGAPGLEFSKDGAVHQTRDFGFLAWHLGPPGGPPVVSGFDAAVIGDGRIRQLYTVITASPGAPES